MMLNVITARRMHLEAKSGLLHINHWDFFVDLNNFWPGEVCPLEYKYLKLDIR